MQAMTGLPQFSIRLKIRCPRLVTCSPSSAESVASSRMSAPATKAFSPAPGKQNCADGSVLPNVEKDLFQLRHAAMIERIQHLGPVEGDHRNWRPQFVAQVL